MALATDLIGLKFGRFTVLRYSGKNKHKQPMWDCICDCGNTRTVVGSDLKNGTSKSCGCFRIDRLKIHGKSHTKEYYTWSGMINRCRNPNDYKYPDYGGRGIVVCRRWSKFENFLEDMGPRPDGHELDRINNNEGYRPNNCRWVTRKDNTRNKRNNHLITFQNITKSMIEWSEITNISFSALNHRLNRDGWSIERALTTPLRQRSL